MCLEPKQTTFATLVAVFVACAVILVLPIFSAPIALVASLVFVVASCLARPRLKHSQIDPSTIDSKLLRTKIDSFNKRTATAMFLLGTASTVPISLFVSSDASFIGDSIQVATMVNAWAPLAFVLFAGIVVIGWLPNREPNPFGSLRALFAIALLSFFPISPGSEFNMWLVLVFSMVWVVSLAGATLLLSCEIDQKYAECGQSALGRNVSFLCIGVLVGLAVIMFVKSFVPQFAGIVGRNSDGTMLICSMSMACVMLLFLATNTLITKDMLHEVALFGRGKLAFHVPEGAIGDEPRTGISPNPLARATALADKDADLQTDTSEKPHDHSFVSRCKTIALEYGLTPRELEVLIILAQGNTLARVQEELVISEGTAITHRRNIYRKLDVHSKQELIDFVAAS